MSVSVLRNSTYSEPRILLAGVLALLVHLVFVAIMIFGLSWKDHPPEGMVVDIWTELPKPIQEPVKTQPPPKQLKPAPEPVKPKSEPQPEQPKPEPPKPEPVKQEPAKPVPQKAVVEPPVKKPDIAMKEKPEPIKETKPDLEELKKKEQEKAKEQERLKELEKKKELEKQKELDKQKELQKQKEKELAAQRQREQEAKSQRETEAQRAAQQAAARNQATNEISKYVAMITAKVKSRTVMPPDLPGNPVAEFSVTLLPGGDILDVRLTKSSGHAAFDNAVERAIFLSKPLPLPPDPALFNEFRNLNIKVHYRE